MLAAAHARDIRVIVDIVPNHTSDRHAWFQSALAAPEGSPEREWYVFRDGKGVDGDLPPNDWRSIFGGPAWTRTTRPDGTPGQWYLHLFDASQPDLNWENPRVHAEFEQILRFWLDRGVDGFRVDVAHGLVKAPGLPDAHDRDSEQMGADPGAAEDGSTGVANHGPMFDQDGVHDIYRAWRTVLDDYPGDRALVAEAWVEPLTRLAHYVRADEMHQAFNFEFLTTDWSAEALRAVVTDSLTAMAAVGAPATWVLSNHDVVRHASRLGLATPMPKPTAGIKAEQAQPDEELGLRRARAATLFMLGLPGSAYVYQGEELGLPEHTSLPDDLRQDPAFFRTHGAEAGRDGCRIPIPWERDAPGLGFGPTGRTWLPQPESYGHYAADGQRGVADSTFELYRAALASRRREDLGLGNLSWVDEYAGSPDVVAYRNRDVVVLANLGSAPVDLPAGVEVLLESNPVVTENVNGRSVPSDTTVWLRA
jgi:alpha-glucosidase